MSAGFLRFSAVVLLTALGLTGAPGQVPGMKQAVDAVKGLAPQADSKAAGPNQSLQDLLDARREELGRLEAATPPAGLDAAEIESRRYHLEQTVFLLSRLIKNSGALADARKKAESSKADLAAWAGFRDKPPYSILMVDELLNEKDAVLTNLTSQESSLSNAEGMLGTAVAEAKAAETEMGKAVQVLKDSGEKDQALAKWRVEAADGKAGYLTIRVTQIEEAIKGLKERVSAAKSDLALVDRKIDAARKQMVFSDEDITKLKKGRDERKSLLKKDKDTFARRLKAAITDRDKASAALAALTGKSAETEGVANDLETAKFRLEAMEDRVEAIQSMQEGVDYLILLEDSNVQLYQIRRELMGASSLKDRDEELAEMTAVHARLKALETVLENEQTSISANLGKFEARAGSASAGDPRISVIIEQRAINSERLAMLQRMQKAVTTQRRLARRWINEYTPEEKTEGWTDRVSSLGSSFWSAVKKVWGFELTHFEEKVELDGKTLISRTPFTLGTLLKAVLFFTIGYVAFSRIAKRIQAAVVSRGHIADAQARTLRNWGMILAGFFLVLGTFQLLKIPLTVFAFLGGAMAIGIGIGTQNIIKNFVSGIILLAERKIRVGDVLEVEGFIGKVTEINTRSSVVRSADDMETIVPNSVFLENRVTNWTLTNAKVRRVLQVGVAYGSPVQTVMELLTESAGRHGLICKEPAPFAVFQDFGDSALVFHLYYWLDLRGSANNVVVASDLRLMIEKRFTELQIGVPFPQRDLRLSADNPLRILWARDTEQSGEH